MTKVLTVYETVQRLRQENRIDEHDVSALLFDSQLESVLRVRRKKDIKPDFVLARLAAVNQRSDALQTEALQAQESHFHEEKMRLEQATADATAAASLADKRLVDAVTKAKQRIRSQAEKRTNRVLLVASLLVAALLVVLNLAAWTKIEGLVTKIEWLVPLIGYLLLFRFAPERWKATLRTRVFGFIYRRLLERSEVPALEEADVLRTEPGAHGSTQEE